MQLASLATEKTFIDIVGIPEIQITDLRTFDADDSEQMTGGDMEGFAIAWRYYNFVYFFHAAAGIVVKLSVEGRQVFDAVTNNRFGCFAGFGVSGDWVGVGHFYRLIGSMPTIVGLCFIVVNWYWWDWG